MLKSEIEKIHALIDEKGYNQGRIVKIMETQFFPLYNNIYSGYFVNYKPDEGNLQTWFIVDMTNGFGDKIWFAEKVR